MNTKCVLAFLGCVLWCLSAVVAEPTSQRRLCALGDESSIRDFNTDLAGTVWKAVPAARTRPDLAPMLAFAPNTVAPEGYRCEINSADSLTIHLNDGGTQEMARSPDGRHLKFAFNGAEYTYELVELRSDPKLNLTTELAGTKWRAVPATHVRPGLEKTQTFTADTVGPQGYRYDVSSPETITIHFNHGDTQLLLLGEDGRNFKFIFKGKNYEYQLESH